MPETAAGRALLEAPWMLGRGQAPMPDQIDAIEAEARALGRAEAREAVRIALEADVAHLLDVSDILAAIDNLETPAPEDDRAPYWRNPESGK